jgi:hypothetical protein
MCIRSGPPGVFQGSCVISTILWNMQGGLGECCEPILSMEMFIHAFLTSFMYTK